MQKKFKLRYVWITGIFIILVIILYLVIEYKVKYEDMTINKYLYFYNCSDKLCVTNNLKEIKDGSSIYSKYLYDYNSESPSYQYVRDKYVIIEDNNKYFYYDYIKGAILSNYQEYKILDINYLIVKNNDKYGIIDLENNIVLDIKYDNIEYVNKVLNVYDYGKRYIFDIELKELKEG